jgi:hypothetical protein
MFAAILFVAVAGILFYGAIDIPCRLLSRRGFSNLRSVV